MWTQDLAVLPHAPVAAVHLHLLEELQAEGDLGAQTIIPTHDFRTSPGEREHRETRENRERPGGMNPEMGISFRLLDIYIYIHTHVYT